MASNQLTSGVTEIRQGRIHIWRLLAMVAVLAAILTVLLLIVASAA
ncbi:MULTISPECIES: hypothetical protein [Gordonia]|uniref:Uncharacterized protein n=1 Tax=Gordonia cholesterolivorans TaxID=559625 RepID=A0ABN3I1L8_9ACTN|nr:MULTISPECIES: hypothetical protein [Gordonia]WFN92232.1 hypothetical protein P5P27_15845 [Gordonia sihwensis]